MTINDTRFDNRLPVSRKESRRKEGREEGREDGREDGREEGREEFWCDILRVLELGLADGEEEAPDAIPSPC
jgi:flagellar biosynthesis/type III secretory pathway protein FliH